MLYGTGKKNPTFTTEYEKTYREFTEVFGNEKNSRKDLETSTILMSEIVSRLKNCQDSDTVRFDASNFQFLFHGQLIEDLVAVIPGVEQLLLRVVLQTGVGAVPLWKVNQRGLLCGHHVVDVKHALHP